MLINGIEVHVSEAGVYPYSNRTKPFMENALKKVIENNSAISHMRADTNIEFNKNLFQVNFGLLGISSYFEVKLTNFADFIKFQGMLNLSSISTREQINQIIEDIDYGEPHGLCPQAPENFGE